MMKKNKNNRKEMKIKPHFNNICIYFHHVKAYHFKGIINLNNQKDNIIIIIILMNKKIMQKMIYFKKLRVLK